MRPSSEDNSTISDLINEAREAATVVLNTLEAAKSDKNAKLMELMRAITKKYPYKIEQISSVFVILDHLMRIAKKDPVLTFSFKSIYDGLINYLASNCALFLSVDPKLKCGDDLLSLDETTFFKIFSTAIMIGNDDLVANFLNEQESLRKHIIQDNKFKVLDGAKKSNLNKFSPLILSAIYISAKHGKGLTIFGRILSVRYTAYEYGVTLLMLLKSDDNKRSRKAFRNFVSQFEKDEKRKKTFLHCLTRKNGELLFAIADTGNVFFFGNILKVYDQDTCFTDITSLRKEDKTLFQIFSARQDFQNNKSGNLEITDYISSGSYAFVFKGRIGNDREVAVKYSNPEFAEKTTLNEFDILRKAGGSEYIISPVELIRTERMLAIILDFAAGGSLEGLILSNKLRNEQIPNILIQLFAGLCVLHNNLIVYSDCKSANILISAEGNAKLADFGLSVVYPDEETPKCISGGSRLYMAPERLKNPPIHQFLFNEAALTDIYAAALIIWEVFARKEPYPDILKVSELKSHVLAGHRPDVSCLAHIKDLSVFTERCWADDPKKRPDANSAHAEITNTLSPK